MELLQAFYNSTLPYVLAGVLALSISIQSFDMIIRLVNYIKYGSPTVDQKINERGRRYGRYSAGRSDYKDFE